MSNHNKQGFLDRLNFHKAMDIIALAQLVRGEWGYQECHQRATPAQCQSVISHHS